MKTFLAIAWRNIMRNKKRSFLTIFAIAIGILSIIFLRALMDGAYEAMIDNMTSMHMGHLQITNEAFIEKPNLKNTVVHGGPAIEVVKSNPNVVAYSPRLQAMGMLQYADKVQGAALLGVDPSLERDFGKLDDFVVAGRWLEDDDIDSIVVGAQLAKNLKIGVNDVVTPHSINLWEDYANLRNMTVVGIVKTNVPDIDGSLAFVRRDELATALFSGSGYDWLDREFLAQYRPTGMFTELAILAENQNKLVEIRQELNESLDAAYQGTRTEYLDSTGRMLSFIPEEEISFLKATLDETAPQTPLARTWGEIVPWIEQSMRMKEGFTYVILLIFLIIIVAGILNTVLMSVMERTREFGIMRALGTKRHQIAYVVCAEAMMLGVVGLIAGALVGTSLSVFFGEVGLNMYGSFDESLIGQFYMDPVVYPRINLDNLVANCSIILIAVLIISIYPARKAANMEPVEAIKALG